MSPRELRVDLAISAGVTAAALALWVAGGAPAPGADALGLALLLAVLTRVCFYVGPSFTHAGVLGLVPLLLLTPPLAVPLLVACAHVVAVAGHAAVGGRPRRQIPLAPADAAYAVAPALALALAPGTPGVAAEGLLLAAGYGAMCATDYVLARVRYAEVRESAWVYGVDALLLLLGFALALAAREEPLAPAAMLPLVALLALFARERHTLRHRATHDPLTGLANRELFRQRMDAALREGEAAVLYIDLDGFKPVNDRLGHAAGDEVLRIVARRLEASVRATDTVARLGGDEFVLLLDEPGRAEAVAERVQSALAQPLELDGEPVAVSASVGVAAGCGDLLAEADRAMYAVKRDTSGDERLVPPPRGG